MGTFNRLTNEYLHGLFGNVLSKNPETYPRNEQEFLVAP